MRSFFRQMLAIAFVFALCSAVQIARAQQAVPVVPDSKAAATSNPGQSAATPQTKGPHTAELVIGPGDLVEVSMFGVQDYHQEARVGTSGEIALPLIGPVHVAGLTPDAAQKLIDEKLIRGQFYKNPQILVFVKEYGSGGVYVLGEVQKPGFYPLTNFRRLLEAISVAGGTTPKASNVVTITNDKRPQHTITVTLADDSNPAEAGTDENLQLMPGDTVQVGKAPIVYVVGDVRMPTGIVMEHSGLTVLGALAMAQGANNTAALKSARLIRRTAGGKPEEVPLQLNKMLAAQAPDLLVQPNDILFIPRSDKRSILTKVGETALQMSTGALLYGRF